MKIFLTGFMGTGKTTIGKKLANSLNLRFIDLDFFIEEKHKAGIPFIFSLIGEEGFRLIENRSLLEVINDDNYVLSTGGGTPCFYDNMKLMNDQGITVYLKMSPSALLNRLKSSKKKRPLIETLSDAELLDFISQKLKEREFFYKQSKIIVNSLDLKIENLKNLILAYTS